MNYSSLKKIGELLRERRKKENLTLEKVADQIGLSTTTCWRIERGDNNVSRQKYRMYCEWFSFDFDELYTQLRGQNLINLHQRLKSIELNIELGHDLERCIEEINNIQVDPNSPYSQLLYYISSKAHFYAKNYDRAERDALRAKSSAEKHLDEHSNMNILACAYNILSNIYAKRNDITAAFEAAHAAVAVFERQGERKEVYYMSLLNKAIFLLNEERMGEAQKIVDELITEINQINKTSTKAAVYGLQAKIKKKYKLYDEALTACYHGLELAALNKLHDRAFDLLLIRGSILEEMNMLKDAEASYLHALGLPLRFPEKMPIAFNALGDLKLKNKEFSKARHYYGKSLESDESPHHIDALLGLSKIFLNENNDDSACRTLQKAHEIALNHRCAKKEKEIVLLLCKCFEKKDQKRYFSYLKRLQTIMIELEE